VAGRIWGAIDVLVDCASSFIEGLLRFIEGLLRLCRIRWQELQCFRRRWSFRKRQGVEDTRMNWDRIEGNWKEVKGKLHQQWGKLTNDDVEMIHGKRIELAGRLQHRYGVAKDEAERQIDDWLKMMH
jgi:uncharacterized protein YjbJ (UPF0337 family)